MKRPFGIFCLFTVLFSIFSAAQAADKSSSKMTNSQKSAIVSIEDGNGGGATGFFCKINGKIFLVTNVHVLAAIKTPVITTLTGETVKIQRVYMAKNHDVAIATVAAIPDGCEPLEALENVQDIVKEGDGAVICGNSLAKGTMLETPGKVIATGPRRIELDTPFFEGNSGSPVFHEKTGKVIGVAAYVVIMNKDSSRVTSESMSNRNSAIKKSVRYFAYRLDSIKSWTSPNLKDIYEHNAIVNEYREKLSLIGSFFGDKDGGITLEIKGYKDLYDAISQYQQDSQKGEAIRRRAHSDFMYRMGKLCRTEAQKLKGYNMISPMDESRDNLIRAFMDLAETFEKAQK